MNASGSGALGRQVAKNAGILAGFNALTVLAALALDILVAALFGLGAATDAFFLAYTLPQFLSFVLAGSFQAALIPVFAGDLHGPGGGAALWRSFRLIGTVAGAALIGIAVLGVALALPLLRLLGSGIPGVQQRLAAELARILFLMLPALGLTEIMRSALIARNRYVVSSASNLVYFGAALPILVLTARAIGIYAVAWSYLGAAIAQALWLAAAVLLDGGSLMPIWAPRDAGLRELVRLVLQRMTGVALRRSGTIFERFVASFLPPGTVTALTYAQRVSLSLWQIFADSVSTAVLPDLSTAAQRGQTTRVREGLSVAFRLLSFVVWPAATGLAVLSLPVVRLLFQRGQFDLMASAQTASLLRIYAFSIPALALVQIFLAPFYAQKDARTPTVHMAIILGVNVVLVALMGWWLGATGLAIAYTLSAFVSLVRSYLIAQRALGSFKDLGLLRYSGLVAASCLGMGGVVWLGSWIMRRAGLAVSNFWLLAGLLILSGLGLLTYLLLTHALGMSELSTLVSLLRRRQSGVQERETAIL